VISQDEVERRIRDAGTLARIEERQVAMDEKLDDLVGYTRNLSKRVGVLERWRSRAAAVVGFVLAAAGYFRWGGN